MTRKKEETFYQQNKEACKELIDEIIGENYGVIPRQQRRRERADHQSQFDDKSLIRSSKKAIKAVFEDPKMGKQAYNYLAGLKSDVGKTPEQIEADNIEFQQKADDVKGLLGGNKRKLKPTDAVRPRVVGQAAAAKNQASYAGAAVLGAGALGVTGGLVVPGLIAVGGLNALAFSGLAVSLPFMPAAGVAGTANERAENAVGNRGIRSKTVTKINPEKEVKSDSKGFNDDLRPELREYEELGLQYKDMLFERMTGEKSPNYKEAQTRLETRVDVAVEKGIKQATEGVSEIAAENAAIEKYRSGNPREKERGDISKTVASFLIGDESQKSPADRTHLERVQSSSSVSSERQL